MNLKGLVLENPETAEQRSCISTTLRESLKVESHSFIAEASNYKNGIGK